MAKKVSYEHSKFLMENFEVETKNGHNWVENRLFGVGAEGKCRAKLEGSENRHLRARNGQKHWKIGNFMYDSGHITMILYDDYYTEGRKQNRNGHVVVPHGPFR